MAEDDEIDILGDFSFNSCFAQNNQGIPSCSNREDTVHPQWLLDSTANNWYDIQKREKISIKDGPSRRLLGNNATNKYNSQHTIWSLKERDLLKKEMAKYGRNVRKISQSLNTKTEAEIQALIEAEYGIQLDTPDQGLVKDEGLGDAPTVIQEEIVAADPINMHNVLSMVTTGCPTIQVGKRLFAKKTSNKSNVGVKSKHSHILNKVRNPSDTSKSNLIVNLGIFTPKINEMINKSKAPNTNQVKTLRKTGNHRRKVTRNIDGVTHRNRNNIKSFQDQQRKDSGLSDGSLKSPKMQIVLGSGQALPLSEGEQVIKLEKKKDSECESDVEVDVDSESESLPKQTVINEQDKEKSIVTHVVVSPRKFEPMPKRNRKIPLDGGGGYTIMHTDAGDLYEIGQEPRKERLPKKVTEHEHLIQCKLYNTDKPAPCEVYLDVSALIKMDVHAHSSRAEVMGLVGGEWCAPRLHLKLYRKARASAAATHCEMDPVSQASASEWVVARGEDVCGWHHSHPRFPAAPSLQDLRTQRSLQRALRWPRPFLALITSQHCAAPHLPAVTRLRCFRVEETEGDEVTPVGYQLKVKLVPDLTPDSVPRFLRELHEVVDDHDDRSEFTVNMTEDVCPQSGLTYTEKCILSMRHHLHSAGYEHDAPLVELLVRGVRDVIR